MKSKSESNTTSISLVGNSNKIAQILKMPKKIPARMDESDESIETMVFVH